MPRTLARREGGRFSRGTLGIELAGDVFEVPQFLIQLEPSLNSRNFFRQGVY